MTNAVVRHAAHDVIRTAASSAFDLRHSAFDLRHSAFGILHSKFGILPSAFC